MTPTDKTKVNITDIGLVDLDAGEFYEGDVADDSITLISSDKPVLVMQYMKGPNDGTGDPAMVLVPPTEMFSKDVIFPAYKDPYAAYYMSISIITQCSHKQGLIYDDNVLDGGFDTISRDGICAFRREVTAGTHSVRHRDLDVTFSVVVSGQIRGSGVAYLAGFNIIPGTFKLR